MTTAILQMGALLLLAATGAAQVRLDDTGRRGTVQFRVVDATGRQLAGVPRISIYRLSGATETEVPVSGNEPSLEYGRYRIRALYPAALPAETLLEVRERFQVAQLCFFVAPIESTMDLSSSVKGKLPQAAALRGCTWLRVVHAFQDSLAQNVLASRDGEFRVEGLREGTWLFLAVGPEGVCATATANILAGDRGGELSLKWQPSGR